MGSRGLQEERVERDAWQGILDALTRLKAAKEKEEIETISKMRPTHELKCSWTLTVL